MTSDDGRFREVNELTETVIGAAIEVHRELGPGLLESVYERCLCHELTLRGLALRSQVPLPIRYKGMLLSGGYSMDIVIDERVLVELKAVTTLLPVHEAQLMTYLKLSGLKVGLLMNFCVPMLKDGLKRFVN